jgi:hypothetical protein
MSTPSTHQNTALSSTSSTLKSINLIDMSDDDKDSGAQGHKQLRRDKSNALKMITVLGDLKDVFQVAYAKPKVSERNAFATVSECIAKHYYKDLMLINVCRSNVTWQNFLIKRSCFQH